MGQGNVRVHERFEVSLGGVQIASVVVGALIALALVFVLGFQVGQRVGTRRAEAARPATLGDLDAASVTSTAPAGKGLTFSAELPRARPAPPPPRTPPAATAEPAAAPAPASPPPASPAPAAAQPAATPAAEASPPAAAPAPPSRGGWTVQLGASQRREEAEALAHRVQSLGPRIEEADVPGKGHFFRVRVGRFDSRAEAEKYRSDVVRETGIAGALVPPPG